MKDDASNENIITCNNAGIRFSKTTPTPTLAGWLNSKFSDNESNFFLGIKEHLI